MQVTGQTVLMFADVFKPKFNKDGFYLTSMFATINFTLKAIMSQVLVTFFGK